MRLSKVGWLEFLPQLEIKVFLHYEVEIEERGKLPVVVNKNTGLLAFGGL